MLSAFYKTSRGIKSEKICSAQTGHFGITRSGGLRVRTVKRSCNGSRIRTVKRSCNGSRIRTVKRSCNGSIVRTVKRSCNGSRV